MFSPQIFHQLNTFCTRYFPTYFSIRLVPNVLLVSVSKYLSFCNSKIVLLISFWRWLPCWTATANGCSANGSPTSVKLQFCFERNKTIYNNLLTNVVIIRYGLVVRISGSHPGGPGSIPGIGKVLFCENNFWRSTSEFQTLKYSKGSWWDQR